MRKLFSISIIVVILILAGCSTKDAPAKEGTSEKALEDVCTTLKDKNEISASLYNTAKIGLPDRDNKAQFEEEGTYTSDHKSANIKTTFYTLGEGNERLASGELTTEIIGKEKRGSGYTDGAVYPFGEYYASITDYLKPEGDITVSEEGSHKLYTFQQKQDVTIRVEIDENNLPVKLSSTYFADKNEIVYQFSDFKFS